MTKKKRRDPYSDLGDTLAAISGRDKRDRSWEAEQRAAQTTTQVSYRGMPRWIRDKIKEIAKGHKVTTDQVARRLLEYALAQYDAGAIKIETQAQAVKYVVLGGPDPKDSGGDSGIDSGT